MLKNDGESLMSWMSILDKKKSKTPGKTQKGNKLKNTKYQNVN